MDGALAAVLALRVGSGDHVVMVERQAQVYLAEVLAVIRRLVPPA